MATAKEAKEWAPEHLRGNCDAIYTPFSGPDGERVDEEALRALVRHCLVDLDHDGLWLLGGTAEFWALTMEERKRVAEVCTDELRSAKSGALLQICTGSTSPQDCVELTLHAQQLGADICYVITPYYECSGAAGFLEFLRYVAARTDVALGLFNSYSTGLVLTPEECAELYREIPAVCAIKAGNLEPMHSWALHRLAPGLVIWEPNAEASIRLGVPYPGALGSNLFLYEVPEKRLWTDYHTMVVQGEFEAAAKFARESGLEDVTRAGGTHIKHPDRPEILTHWGSSFKWAAQVLGLPVGDFPHSRPPQTRFPDELKGALVDAYTKAGYIPR